MEKRKGIRKENGGEDAGVMLSVVMPVYNVGEFVGEAVESVLASDYGNLELVVVDDCCTDDTMERVAKAAGGDRRVRVIRNAHNMGAGMSRRAGIEASKGGYVLTMDGDDKIRPTFLGHLMRTAVETGADIVSGGMTLNTGDHGAYKAISYGSKTVEGAEQVTDVFGEDIVFVNNKVINRRLYGLVPYCGLRYAEDTTTIAQILYYSNKSVYVDDTGYWYRQRKGSLTHRVGKVAEALYKAVCAKRLVEFYKDKDPAYATKFNIRLFVEWANKFLASDFDDAFIDAYKELFDEFVRYYVKVVHGSMAGKR